MSLNHILAQHGVTAVEAYAALATLVHQPQALFDAANQYKLSTAMVAELAGVSLADAQAYFSAAGLDSSVLDAHASARSSHVFLSDLYDGDIFIYAPESGQGQKIYSFNKQITDIAVAGNGDIYATDFTGLYRYDWATGQQSKVLNLNNDVNSLVIEGNYIAIGSSLSSEVQVFTLDTFAFVGSLNSASARSAGVSQGDLAVVDGVIYRTASSGGLVSVGPDGSTQVNASQVRGNYFGLAGDRDGHVLAFDADGRVQSYDPRSGELERLPDVELVGLGTVSGAAEVLQMHLYAL